MDFGSLPPEVNSARMYTGPGSGPLLAAASAWDRLAAELSSAAAAYQSVIGGLTGEGWAGPASAAMAAAAEPYVAWMSAAAGQAEQTAAQAKAAAAAFDAAHALTVPPTAVTTNRTQLVGLVSTNFLGQNTPAIALNEAHYGQMWAQDGAAMYGYAAASAAAAHVAPFTAPHRNTNPTAQLGQDAAVAQATGSSTAAGTQSALSQVISTVPPALQGLSTPVGPTATGGDVLGVLSSLGINDPGDTLGNAVTNLMSSSFSPMGMAGITQAGADIAVIRGAALAAADPLGLGAIDPFDILLPNLGFGGAGGGLHGLGGGLGASLGAPAAAASAAVGRATAIGALSVPQSWTAATPVVSAASAATPFPAAAWTTAATATAEQAGMPGMPGMPLAGAGAGRGAYGFAAPRYGFKPTVIGRPVVAG